jgi:hypothetical protein
MIAESPNRDSGSATRGQERRQGQERDLAPLACGPIDNRLRLLFTVAG